MRISRYDVETLCSLSTAFRTVGRSIMRSCHAVYGLSSFMGSPAAHAPTVENKRVRIDEGVEWEYQDSIT
jgi:hypothetical protein